MRDATKAIIYGSWIYMVGCFCCSSSCWAQSNDGLITENQSQYDVLRSNPLDLNTATFDELLLLPEITTKMAENILTFRRVNGGFTRRAQLLQISDVNRGWYLQIKDLVEVITVYKQLSLQLTSSNDQTSNTVHSIWDKSEYMLQYQQRNNRHFNAGVTLSRREHKFLTYDRGKASLRVGEISQQPTLETLFVSQRTSNWSVIVGNYRIGYGEGLALDNTYRTMPHGWYTPGNPQYDWQSGRFRQSKQLFGMAAELLCTTCKGMRPSLSMFLSRQKLGAYQYDIRYGGDIASNEVLMECTQPGSRRMHYTCDEDGLWYTTNILTADGGENLYYQQLENVYLEQLVGAHLSITSERQFSSGVVAFNSQQQFLLSAPEIRFSPSAQHTDTQPHEVTGVYFKSEIGAHLLSSEVAHANSDWAGLLRWRFRHDFFMEMTFRYYGPEFDNAYGRGIASADEYLGSKRRNEAGMRWLASGAAGVYRWRSWWDVWTNPFQLKQTADGLQIHRLNNSPLNWRSKQWLERMWKHHWKIAGEVDYSQRYIWQDDVGQDYALTKSVRASTSFAGDWQRVGFQAKLTNYLSWQEEHQNIGYVGRLQGWWQSRHGHEWQATIGAPIYNPSGFSGYYLNGYVSYKWLPASKNEFIFSLRCIQKSDSECRVRVQLTTSL